MGKPPADLVRSLLGTTAARDLVLAARDVITEHGQDAWSYRIGERGIVPIKTICACSLCGWLTPISRILLPEEQLSATDEGKHV